MSAASDYAENAVIDRVVRGQSTPAFPTTWSFDLYSAAPGETGGGTKLSYSGYAAATQTANMTNFAGTQSAGSTTASSGTGGQTSNNNLLTFGTAATSGPQTGTHMAWGDGTNMWFYGALTNARVINNGDVAPTAAAGTLTLTVA